MSRSDARWRKSPRRRGAAASGIAALPLFAGYRFRFSVTFDTTTSHMRMFVTADGYHDTPQTTLMNGDHAHPMLLCRETSERASENLHH